VHQQQPSSTKDDDDDDDDVVVSGNGGGKGKNMEKGDHHHRHQQRNMMTNSSVRELVQDKFKVTFSFFMQFAVHGSHGPKMEPFFSRPLLNFSCPVWTKDLFSGSCILDCNWTVLNCVLPQ